MPEYDPMDDEHREGRRRSVDRMVDVETAKRHQQPRDVSLFLIVLAVLVGTVSVVSTTLAVWSFVGLQRQQNDLKNAATRQAVSRKATSDLICKKINGNVRASQAQVDTLNDLIMRSVKASRAFEKTYVSLGLPDYKHRLADAERQTARLASKKPHGIDCEQLADDIRRAAK